MNQPLNTLRKNMRKDVQQYHDQLQQQLGRLRKPDDRCCARPLGSYDAPGDLPGVDRPLPNRSMLQQCPYATAYQVPSCGWGGDCENGLHSKSLSCYHHSPAGLAARNRPQACPAASVKRPRSTGRLRPRLNKLGHLSQSDAPKPNVGGRG